MLIKSRRAFATTAAALSILLITPSAAQAGVPNSPDATAQANNGVYALAQAGDRIIVGGMFSRFGGRARASVAAVHKDTGVVDKVFNPGTNGVVRALAVSEDGSTVFIGGVFSVAGGSPRANLAAVDAVTGVALPDWQANTAGTTPDVNSLAVKGNRLYVAGRFTGIDGTTRKRLVALDVATGNLVTSFNPAPNGNVREVVVSPDGTKVYGGGAFSKIGRADRPAGVGEVLASNGDATTFNPPIAAGGSGNVVTIALTPDGSRLFWSTESNLVLAGDPAAGNGIVWTRKFAGNTQGMLASASGELYLGGHFSQDQTTGQKRPSYASVYFADGTLTPWNPKASGGKLGGWAFLIEGNHLHVGGFTRYWDGVLQRGYARFTGTP
ncbi:hypothetical protein [Nocardioides sp.]|uniref:hypothetical protein n=1 Tax=Nocardioides sp. TaxID=35761 RepID=UPI002ECFD1FA